MSNKEPVKILSREESWSNYIMAKVNQDGKHWWNFKGRGKFGVKSDQLGYWSSSVKEIMRAYYIGNRNGMEVLKMRDAKEVFSIACMHAQSLSRVWLFGTLWTVGCQAPVSMGFPRQEYWSQLLFPSPRDLPDPGVEPVAPASSLALQANSLPLSHPGSPYSIGLAKMLIWFFPYDVTEKPKRTL